MAAEIPIIIAHRELPTHRIRIFDTGNNRDTVRLNKGDRFLIRLYENRQSGIVWHVRTSSGICITDDWSSAVSRRQSYACMHLWGLKAIKSGWQKLTAACEKSLENGHIYRFTYSLDIYVS